MSVSLQGVAEMVEARRDELRVCGFSFRVLSPNTNKMKQANDRSQRGLPRGGLLKANVSGLRYSDGAEAAIDGVSEGSRRRRD